jgi:hypothetical protein
VIGQAVTETGCLDQSPIIDSTGLSIGRHQFAQIGKPDGTKPAFFQLLINQVIRSNGLRGDVMDGVA